ncbi:MAG: hypothetical protein QM758_11085 [Armatimonas sp.]
MQSEVLTGMITRSSGALVKATTELGEKALWNPMGKGRNAVDQCVECGFLSTLIAESLKTQSSPPFDREKMVALKAENDTPEKALALLNSGTDELLAAIAAFPAENWGVTMTLPWGENSFADLVRFVYWNNTYHEGQINYIQTLAEGA